MMHDLELNMKLHEVVKPPKMFFSYKLNTAVYKNSSSACMLSVQKKGNITVLL